MLSVVISFVGSQDPYSDNTVNEGSIVTLVRHLLSEQQQIIYVSLMYTIALQQKAIETKEYLVSEQLLPEGTIDLVAVDPALSDDPVDLVLAIQAARQAIERSIKAAPSSCLELNASSGTPTMKSALTSLHAAGIATHSRVWEVRNPKKMQPGQTRVFATDVSGLRREFDLRVVKQQVKDYNYSGALVTLDTVQLRNDTARALLEFGRRRKAFSFDAAYSALKSVSEVAKAEWEREIAPLRQRDYAALAKECYFIAQMKLKNREYSDFLVLLVSFQEVVLRALLRKAGLSIDLQKSETRSAETIWSELHQIDRGKLKQYLETYRIPKTRGFLTQQGFMNVTVMTALLSYYPDVFEATEAPLAFLSNYIDDRNRAVHRLEGVSEIDGEQVISAHLKTILKQVISVPSESPFDRLNEVIISYL
jgi:hypothetical protein